MPRDLFSEQKPDDMRHYVRYENGKNLRCDEHRDCDDRRDREDDCCDKHEKKRCDDDCCDKRKKKCRDDDCCDKREKKCCDDDRWDLGFECECDPCQDHKKECRSSDKICRFCNSPSVCKALRIANTTGQQVTIFLKSGAELEGVIVEKLFPTSFRVWLEPAEPVEPGEDIDKAIVAIHAVDFVSFDLDEDFGEDFEGYFEEPDERCLEGIREALELALLTNQSVNVSLNNGREEPSKVEGIIKRVGCESFTILSEEENGEENVERKIIKIEKVEYVEYS